LFINVLNQILKRQTSHSHYGSKVQPVTITVFKYRNNIGQIVVKAVPYSVCRNDYKQCIFHIVKIYKDKEVKKNVKNICLSMCDVKIFLTFTSPNMETYILNKQTKSVNNRKTVKTVITLTWYRHF
jgi:hypothetical protein